MKQKMSRPLRQKHSPLVAAVLVLVAGLAPAAAQQPVTGHVAPGVSQALVEIEAAAGDAVKATVSPSTGLVTFLSTKPGVSVPGNLPASSPVDLRALDFLESHGAAFGIVDPRDLALRRISAPDEVGMEHARFRQTYRGVPVSGGELSVHLRGADVVAVNARTLSGLEDIDVTPAIDASDAAAVVELWLAETLDVFDAELSEPELELFNRSLFEGRSHFTRLAWFVQARKADLREFFWIDAKGGKLLLRFSQLTDARDREVYNANSTASLPGTLKRVEGGLATGDADEDAAYDYSGDTYDYFFNEHGRDSYDDAGATLVSTVDYCPSPASCPFANAFWNGTQMVYGDGFPAADDVDAHELTHAVTEFTANLFYYMQSGALNESFSDIFGETVDLTNTGGTDTPAVRWQMGEDVPGIGAIRDMMDPTNFGDPGKMSDAQFVCGDDYRTDNGGVHSNSGVPNHAFALMVDGGSYNGFTVTGIGLTKAGKIQYRTLAYYLLSASDFLDNYHALKQSCQDLIGVAGITAADCTEVGDALDAVEMSSVWPCVPTQAAVPAFCPTGQAPSMFHHEDYESFPIAACPSSAVPTSWCTNKPTSLLGSFATSGVQSIWGYNRPTAGTMSISTTLAGTLPANARMQFNHSYGFENSGTSYWDGGVVEYSTNGGATWVDAGGLITAGQAYGGTVSSCCSNPLGGLSAFVRDTWGFTGTQLDLTALGGGSFGYRFKVGTDFSIDEYGWFVDDVRIFSCAACVTDRVLDNAYNGTASLYQASNSVTAGSGFTVSLNEDVTFDTGNFIDLDNGFGANTGSQFAAKLTPGICP